MGVREGGSYVAEGKGDPRLVEKTRQEDAHRLDPSTAGADDVTAPGAPLPDAIADPSGSPRRRAGSDTKPQE